MTLRTRNIPTSRHKYFSLFVLAFGLVVTPIWAGTVTWVPVRIVGSALLRAFADF